MKHMTRGEAVNRRVLQRARTVAIIRASSSPERHSYRVAAYLKTAGYDVIPIRPDGGDVAGLRTYATLADVTGPVDLVVIFRRPEAVPAHIDEAAAKQVAAVFVDRGEPAKDPLAASAHYARDSMPFTRAQGDARATRRD
jgi:predicted CoA-binding protein